MLEVHPVTADRWEEAYPVDAAGGRHPAASLFTGTLAMFLRAGFAEVDRPRGAQLVVRRDL